MGGPCINSRGRSWHNQLLDGYEFEVFFLQDVDDLKGGLHTGFGGIVEEDDVEFICFAQNAAGYKGGVMRGPVHRIHIPQNGNHTEVLIQTGRPGAVRRPHKGWNDSGQVINQTAGGTDLFAGCSSGISLKFTCS